MAVNEASPWLPEGADDILGQDRLVASMLRLFPQLEPGGMISLFGAPGSGREIFLRRTAWMLSAGRQRIRLRNPGSLFQNPVWMEPWLISPNASFLIGLANAAVRASIGTQTGNSIASDIITQLVRIQDTSTGVGAGTRPGGAPALDRIGRGFAQLFASVKGNRPGRVIVLIPEAERLSPSRRWEMLDGLALMRRAGVEMNVMLSLDHEGLLCAARTQEPDASLERLDNIIDKRIDLCITIPSLGVRRITNLLRRYLGETEGVLRASFGRDAINRLSVAAAHEPLGSPQFLRRLINRVLLLAEFAQEARSTAELSEAQWAWIVISQRWPGMRQYMQTTARWSELRQTLVWLQKSERNSREMIRSPLVKTLESDPTLFRYLRQHAEDFQKDSDGLLRVEGLLRAAGL